MNAANIYVDIALTTGGDNGTSWANAYRTATGLQSALADAAVGGADTIHIAEGLYKPGSGGASRDTSFDVPPLTTIIGSYDAGGVAGPNISSFPTILSGDRAGDDATPITYASADENFYHVVIVSDANNVRLQTLIIKAGTADSTGQDSRGGGILIEAPDEAGGDTLVELRDCVVLDCFAFSGAGIAVVDEDAGTVAKLIAHRSDFFNNRASLEGGELGGGIVSLDGIVDL